MNENKQPNFYWALFLGLCVVAAAVVWVGIAIMNQPNTLPQPHHVHIPQPASSDFHNDSDFLTEWQVASLFGLSRDELDEILLRGELSGTYTVFRVWGTRWVQDPYFIEEEWVDFSGEQGRTSVVQVPPLIGVLTEVDHRVFSRDRLVEWLNNRIDN